MMPCAASRAEILDPTPHRSRVGRSAITSVQFCAVSTNTPRGLPKSVAILARRRLSPTPTEQCSRVCSSTAACSRRASSTASSTDATVDPTKASSQPSTSRVTPSPRKADITWADAAS